MVRTQLYLPDELYEVLKAKAKARGMTFAGYVRIFLEVETVSKKDKEKSLKEQFPFIGMFGGKSKWKLSKGASDSREIDKAVYKL